MEREEYVTYTAQVQAGNRIYVPSTVRKLLNIREGDYVEVKIKVVRKALMLRR